MQISIEKVVSNQTLVETFYFNHHCNIWLDRYVKEDFFEKPCLSLQLVKFKLLTNHAKICTQILQKHTEPSNPLPELYPLPELSLNNKAQVLEEEFELLTNHIIQVTEEHLPIIEGNDDQLKIIKETFVTCLNYFVGVFSLLSKEEIDVELLFDKYQFWIDTYFFDDWC